MYIPQWHIHSQCMQGGCDLPWLLLIFQKGHMLTRAVLSSYSIYLRVQESLGLSARLGFGGLTLKDRPKMPPHNYSFCITNVTGSKKRSPNLCTYLCEADIGPHFINSLIHQGRRSISATATVTLLHSQTAGGVHAVRLVKTR
jgi:hypothetical protein